MGFISEFIEFLKKRKLWWMVPIIIAMAIIAAVIWGLSPNNPMSPFIYTVF
jgi:hypothetical protein